MREDDPEKAAGASGDGLGERDENYSVSLIRGLTASADLDQAQKVTIQIFLVLQINHQPFLSVSFSRLTVYLLQLRGTFWQYFLNRFLFLSANNNHYRKIAFSRIDCA